MNRIYKITLESQTTTPSGNKYPIYVNMNVAATDLMRACQAAIVELHHRHNNDDRKHEKYTIRVRSCEETGLLDVIGA